MTQDIKIKIGDRFGHLTVVERSENRGKKLMWVCKCDCGKVGTYYGTNLVRGLTKSCGCLRSESSKKNRLPTLGVDDLKSQYPELCKEWDYEANKDLERPLPEQYTKTSGIKVHWKCQTCHEKWEATIASRTSINKKTGKPSGCPYCSGDKPIVGKTDFKTFCENHNMGYLLEEWDFEENKNLKSPTPELYLPYSNAKVHWICHNCGYKWVTSINHRTRGEGCPQCKAHYKTSFPEQAIYYYLKKIYPHTINRDKKRIGAEIDLYIPEIDTGIEYDSFHFHREVINQKGREEEKDNLACLSNMRLIHLRENIGSSDVHVVGDTIVFPKDDKKLFLGKVIDVLFKNLLHIDCDINLRRDSPTILSLTDSEIRMNSIGSKRWDLLEFWDYKKNGKLNPYTVPLSCNTEVWWICPICGKSYSAPPYSKRRKPFGKVVTCQDCYYHRKNEIENWEETHPFKQEGDR